MLLTALYPAFSRLPCFSALSLAYCSLHRFLSFTPLYIAFSRLPCFTGLFFALPRFTPMLSLFALWCSMQILLLSPFLMQNYLITFVSPDSFYIYRFAFLLLKYSLALLPPFITFTLPFASLLLNLFALANPFHNFPLSPNFAKPFYFSHLFVNSFYVFPCYSPFPLPPPLIITLLKRLRDPPCLKPSNRAQKLFSNKITNISL
jgi:hypothetical protein